MKPDRKDGIGLVGGNTSMTGELTSPVALFPLGYAGPSNVIGSNEGRRH